MSTLSRRGGAPPGGGLVAVRVSQLTTGNITVGSTAWATAHTLSLPAEAGDWLEVGLTTMWSNSTAAGRAGLVTLVGGAVVSNFLGSGATYGSSAFFGPPSVYTALTGSLVHQVVAGDLVDGAVAVALRARLDAAGSKVLDASADSPLVLHGRVIRV